ncbi:hypothetical protein [Bacillus sonorensis]|nr:hypothetical protein [Bacillus sonorensis]TWK79146.1 hypothetical protein CHCC20335_2084 [Bacillus paralicheniformis]
MNDKFKRTQISREPAAANPLHIDVVQLIVGRFNDSADASVGK